MVRGVALEAQYAVSAIRNDDRGRFPFRILLKAVTELDGDEIIPPFRRLDRVDSFNRPAAADGTCGRVSPWRTGLQAKVGMFRQTL